MSEHPAKENSAKDSRLNRPLHIGLRHFSAREFLIGLVGMFLVIPFVENLKFGDEIDTVFIMVVLVSGVLAVGGRRRTLVFALALAIPAVVGRCANDFRPDLVPPEIYLGSALIFTLFIAFNFLRYILRAPRVNTEVVCAGISIYLLLGLLWMLAYVMVARVAALHHPPSPAFSFSVTGDSEHLGFNLLYFSFITLSTVGYGDIVPVSKVARMLAMTEAMTGTLYMAVFISRLVALYSSQTAAPSEKKD